MLTDAANVGRICAAFNIVCKKAAKNERWQKATVLNKWGRRNYRAVVRRIIFRLRIKQRLAIFKWSKRSKKGGSAINIKKIGGRALLQLAKLRKRPFTKAKAFRSWSKDWHDFLKKIICTLAYESSICEQIALWRWKRLLGPKKKAPTMIEITKATSCKILASKLGDKIQSNYIAAFNAIKNKDSGSTSKTMFVSNFVLNSLMPIR